MRQGRGLLRRNAALAGFAADIHLHTDLQGRQMFRALRRKTLGDLETVYRVDPGEVLRHLACLVALQGADEMPFEIEIGQRLDLGHAFLHVVLAEGALAAARRLTHIGGRPGLGNGQETRLLWRPPDSLAGCGNARMYGLQVGGNRCHIMARQYISRHSRSTSRPALRSSHFPFGTSMDITELLAFVVKNKASDLHLSAGLPPMIRVHGDVRRINLPPLEHKDVHAMVYDIMNDGQRKVYEEHLECDFSFAVPNLARFRVNAFV